MFNAIVFSALLLNAYVEGKKIGVSLDKVTGNPTIAAVGDSSPTVTASYDATSEGWYYLDVQYQPDSDVSSASVSDKLAAMRLMGYSEGLLTCNEFKIYYPNFYADSFGDEMVSDEVLGFMEQNYKYVAEMAEQNYMTDPYWLTMRGVVEQLTGFIEGYKASECAGVEKEYTPEDLMSSENMSLMHLLMINSWGDLYTIQTKFMLDKTNARTVDTEYSAAKGYGGKARRIKYTAPKSVSGRQQNSTHTEIPRDLRCSSLFKLAPDNSDVYFAHNTWDSFTANGPRTIKHYKTPSFSAEDASMTRDMYLSSSPGLLSSVDDYYTVYSDQSAFAVIETTNDIMAPELFKKVVPESCLSWMRVTASNAMASDGTSWAQVFSRYASGTYTNQWQVGDMNKFVAGSSPRPGFFTVVEEIPGKVHYEDMTGFLNEHKYWPSYNVPYFDDIYHESGNEAACKAGTKNGETDFCYDTCSRAQIFAMRQDTVVDMASMQAMISYNDYLNDPISNGDPCAAIACRRDLSEGKSSYPAGAMDGKASSATTVQASVALARAGKSASPIMHARMGPTHDEVKPFCWSDQAEEYVHEGQPDCFAFEWLAFPPQV